MLLLVTTPTFIHFEEPPRDLVISKHTFLTYGQREIIEVINFVFLCSLVSLFGVTANVINIIIFFKQGFNYTVNISFCGLAISDLCCLITEMWFSICMNPLLKNSPTVPFVPDEMEYLIGGVPSVCFSRITGWITVFITAERCLGIVLPLKVKRIITKKRTFIIIFSIYFVNLLAISPEYPNYYLDWKFYPEKNRSLVGLVTRWGDIGLDGVLFMMLAATGFLSFIAVIIFTALLVTKLGEKSAWRRKATLANEQSTSVSNRDKRTVKMIILIASVMIACYTPGTILTIVTIVEPEFSIFGIHTNAFYALWSFAFLTQNINSSVNIFLYYNMSTKYKQAFHALFPGCLKQLTQEPGERNH